MGEYFRHKIGIALAGFSYATNMRELLLSNNIVLKQDYPSYQFFEPYFYPNKHYISVDVDLHDLDAKVVYALQKDNEKQMKEISQNATNRALGVFSHKSVMCHIFEVFSTLARLQNFTAVPDDNYFHHVPYIS